ncbi:hypothetical protein IFM89_001973 [Coptis chinensis]|uniref:EF-hand domain-containing protein n=1 Tax=Coptis chinensis TaxID=261450 RepID=A0A835HN50_9MAGN|nr:hypothetical protein IFM89_001973 [Coptis chinensis]
MPLLSHRQLSLEQFQQWIQGLDTDRDGRISKQELVEGLRGQGLWFKHWRAQRALSHVDKNSNGFVDGDFEFCELLEYAKEHWGIKFSP